MEKENAIILIDSKTVGNEWKGKNTSDDEGSEGTPLEDELDETAIDSVTDSQNDPEGSETEDAEEEDLEAEVMEAADGGDNVASGDEEQKPEGLLGFKYKKVLKYNCPKASIEPLPEGWVMVSHTCGIPIYLHKKTRVVTWSRPYCLMTGYVMRHKVPVQSIPCLHYQRNREQLREWEENGKTKPAQDADTPAENDIENKEDKESVADTVTSEEQPSVDDGAAKPRVILHGQKDLCLENEDLEKYLDRRFEFEVLKIPQFQKWAQRRTFMRNERRRKLEEAERNSADANKNGNDAGKGGPAKLITFTVEQDDATGVSRNKKFVLNTNGKPMICILHEYAQRVLKVQPRYVFDVREDAAEPFEATIKLNDKAYGTAVAINKKTAKNKAALITLEMLIPGFKGKVESAAEPADMGYFNEVSVTDSRVYELCTHAGQLLPFQLLTECLKRNQGITDTTLNFDVQQGKRKSLNYTMKCGKHTVTGVAKNKKIAKQIASQQILQLLHPKVKTWAELIGMYGKSLAQERARRKQAEQEIFDLKQRRGNMDDEAPSTSNPQSTKEDQNSLEPNPELLAKLREMMLILQGKRERKRKAEASESPFMKKKKLTPMAAAVAAGKGMLDETAEPESKISPE